MRWKPSPSMVVALIALSVALAGGATAASTMITGAQIKDRSITGADIKPGSITTAHIRNGTIGVVDMAPAARRAFSKPGPRGPRGFPGVQGVQGVAGGLDSSKLNVFTGPDVVVQPGDVATATAQCPAGQRATGGGFFSNITHPAGSLPGYTNWSVIVNNDYGFPISVRAYVVCIAS